MHLKDAVLLAKLSSSSEAESRKSSVKMLHTLVGTFVSFQDLKFNYKIDHDLTIRRLFLCRLSAVWDKALEVELPLVVKGRKLTQTEL